jgi:hypothetical protein
MKTLYFDINRTIVCDYVCKPALARGGFEMGVREASFDRMVCVSNVVNTIQFLEEMGQSPDWLAITFDLCWGAFSDQAWFREITRLTRDPEHRARDIDFSEDWWYLDDLAREYFDREGFGEVFATNRGGRICVPASNSDGSEILTWLKSTSKNH